MRERRPDSGSHELGRVASHAAGNVLWGSVVPAGDRGRPCSQTLKGWVGQPGQEDYLHIHLPRPRLGRPVEQEPTTLDPTLRPAQQHRPAAGVVPSVSGAGVPIPGQAQV